MVLYFENESNNCIFCLLSRDDVAGGRAGGGGGGLGANPPKVWWECSIPFS